MQATMLFHCIILTVALINRIGSFHIVRDSRLLASILVCCLLWVQLCLKQCMALIKKGASVFFFPEGTRSKDGKLGPFKVGFILHLVFYKLEIKLSWSAVTTHNCRLKLLNDGRISTFYEVPSLFMIHCTWPNLLRSSQFAPRV